MILHDAHPSLVDAAHTHATRITVPELFGALDSLALALLIVDGDGSPVHVTSALRELLDHEGDATNLLDHVMRLATESSCGTHALRARNAGYQLHVTSTFRGRMGPPVTIVRVERKHAEPLSDAALRDRFGLTPAQIRVARLLAAGHRIAHMATTLGVSIHTARRHTEALRAKLKVRSALDVVAVVLGQR